MADSASKKRADDQFRDEWDQTAQTAQEIRNWDPSIMGPNPDTYRDVPTCAEQQQFIDNLGTFFANAASHGRRQADFAAEADARSREHGGESIDNDLVKFYTQIEAQLASGDTRWTRRVWEVIWGRCRTSRFRNRMQAFMNVQAQIDFINANLNVMEQALNLLQVDLARVTDIATQRRIRNDISRQQTLIRDNIARRTNLIGQQSTEQRAMEALRSTVEDLLREQQRLITEKFGHKIQELYHNRQRLIDRFSKLNNYENAQLQEKLKLQRDINSIDLQLAEIQQELVRYKARRPVFLFERLPGFERFFRVESIPILARNGQVTWVGGMPTPPVTQPGNPPLPGTPPVVAPAIPGRGRRRAGTP